jgi:hypothetical protein
MVSIPTRLAHGILGFSLAAAGVVSQQIVLPPALAGVAGSGSTHVPFGRSTAMRLQAAYDPILFTGPVVVGGVALRADEGETSAQKTVDVELRMSSSGSGVTRLQETFATNRGGDETVVVARKLIDLPAISQTQAPQPFSPPIAFDRPFAYAPAGGSLVLEVAVFGQTPGGYALDTTFLCDSPTMRYGPPGCGPAGGSVLSVDCLTSSVTWGRSVAFAVRDARPGAVTGMLFGTLETGQWNGVAIPSGLAAYGAPGCSLSIDPAVTSSTVADPLGVATYGFFVPSDPRLKGAVLRFQGVALDPSANALGVVTSQPAKVEVCGFEAVGRVFAAGLAAPAGLREIGVAPILELQVR